MKLIVIALAALAAVAIASATDDAEGQALSPEAAALLRAVRPAPPRAETPAFAPRYADQSAARIPGVAQTSVDARLSDADGVVGSLGFMCGLKPGAEKYGAAAARGYDDTGRFVGAKLRVAFK
jgi:hypothetical protein